MFRGRGRGGMRGGLRAPPPGGGAAPRMGFSHKPPPPAGAPKPSTSQFDQHSSGLPLLSKEKGPLVPAPPPVPLPVTPTTDATNGLPSPLPLKPLKPLESGSKHSANYGGMTETRRPPSDEEPRFKRARTGHDHEWRERESDRSSLDGVPLMDSPPIASTDVIKLEFTPPPTGETETEELFYMGKEPPTPAQLRTLLRECIVDLLVVQGKTALDGTRYIAHGDLIFNYFDEINIKGGVKLRDLVPKDEVSQNNLSSLPGITIQQIDGACVCYRITAFDATNRLRCSLKRWEASASEVTLVRSAVAYIKQVTGVDVLPFGAFSMGMANRDDDLLKVVMMNDDIMSSKLQLICAAQANGWSISRISKRDCCPAAYGVTRLIRVQEDQVPCFMTVEIPHLYFHIEIHFMTECGAISEMQRLKHEITNAEPELFLLAKTLRRLVRQPCRANEVDATHISMLLVRSFYISTAYRGMGLYQDYVDLLYFYGEAEEIGDSLSDWSCSDDSLADTIGLPRLENLIHGIQLSLSAADLWWPLYLCS